MNDKTLADRWKTVVEIVNEIVPEFCRKVDRFSTAVLTRQHLFRDVHKIKDVPVSGDEIARITRG